jgi:Zn-dependent oligopeptidase
MRFAELNTAFSNNVLDATKAFGLDVTDASSETQNSNRTQ